MPSLASFLGGSRHQPHGSTQSLNALEEQNQIEDAMRAVALIMNDDVEGAEAALSKGNSPFHKMGKGVVVFLRATLGFEPEIIREASEQLAEAESSAYEYHRLALKKDSGHHSSIYPAGSEYALCLAEAQLLSAIVGVLNESLTESIKAFYKLRKAYITLDSIVAAEEKHVRQKGPSTVVDQSGRASLASEKGLDVPTNHVAGSSLPVSPIPSKTTSEIPSPEASSEGDSDDEDQFFEADESHGTAEMAKTQEYQGHLETEESKRSRPSSSWDPKKQPPSFYQLERSLTGMSLNEGPDMELFDEHPTDVFVHSGSNLCFGLLSLMISMIPPAFSTLLKIVGFRGDKEKGIQMLWQATKFHNIYGAVGGLVLFGYYHGLVGFCDIIPQQGPGSYPKKRLRRLLVVMRERFPQSQLWKLEEARMMANEKQLEKAVAFMTESPPSQLKQLEALRWFERSLECMYMHNYEETSKSFHKCVELNNWSHGLYYYISACAHLEIYRRTKTSDPDEARRQAKKATDLFRLVPKHAGRKRFMARQLPFDAFTVRKVAKWEARANEFGCDFVDAIGVSPIEEIIYFWNGYKRMRPEQLQDSLANLAWSESDANPHWAREDVDEKAILTILRTATMRHLKMFGEARALLQQEILSVDRARFKGHLRDNWTAPCARYEMAASLWAEMQDTGDVDRERIQEISSWLDEVAGWESFDLDARVGIRVTTAKATIRRLGVQSSA